MPRDFARRIAKKPCEMATFHAMAGGRWWMGVSSRIIPAKEIAA
jgi:hypothetical protein